MPNPETPEKSILNIGAKLPEASDIKGFFSKLFTRFKNAKEASEKGSNWKEKILFFISALFSEVEQLSEEEKKIQDETAEKAGQILLQMPDDQLAAAAKKELVGDKEPADPLEKKIVDDVMAVSVGVGKSLGAQKLGKVSGTLDKMKAGEAQIAPEEKALLAASGLKAVAALKINPAYDTVEKFAAALDKLDAATKSNPQFQNLKQSLGKNLLELDTALFTKFLPFIDSKDTPLLYELQRKVTAAPLSYEEAVKLQSGVAKIFPNTKDTDRAKALVTINQIILKDGGLPTNQHLAELVFSINTKDIEKLSEILQS